MRIDLHTHTLLSDGDLLPIELARRAEVRGMDTIAFTDHVSFSTIERVIEETRKDCQATGSWEINTILGVEITHVPVDRIDEIVKEARRLGAELVVVHGESPVEPTQPGTNRAAVSNPEVDILAHPGLISEEEAQLAVDNNVVLEITSRKGHCLSNGHVARMAMSVGAELTVNTDAHSYTDLIDEETARKVAMGAGLPPERVEWAVNTTPARIVRRIMGK